MVRVVRSSKSTSAASRAARRHVGRARTGGGLGRGIEPIDHIVPVALILLVTLLAFTTYVAWRQAVEPALCRRAEAMVSAQHPALFDSLRTWAHMTMRCVSPGVFTSERVELRWDAVGGAFLATYEVPIFGEPRANDVGARSLDKVAPLGTRALPSLMGR